MTPIASGAFISTGPTQLAKFATIFAALGERVAGERFKCDWKHSMVRQLIIMAMFGSLLALIIGDTACAQEFRIESQIYVEGNKLPVSQNITLFSEGIVYDFQVSPDGDQEIDEIVIFDSRNKKMILLDPEKESRLELLDIRVLKILDAVRRDTEQDNRSRFLVDEDYVEEADWSTGWVTLSSPTITYRIRGKTTQRCHGITNLPEFLG